VGRRTESEERFVKRKILCLTASEGKEWDRPTCGENGIATGADLRLQDQGGSNKRKARFRLEEKRRHYEGAKGRVKKVTIRAKGPSHIGRSRRMKNIQSHKL